MNLRSKLGEYMDRKAELLKVVSEAKPHIVGHSFQIYDYTNMPDKRRKDLLKFDPDFDFENLVAVYPFTSFGRIKCGIVFTLYGVYFKNIFEKIKNTLFINYIDIISTLAGYGRFHILSSTDEVIGGCLCKELDSFELSPLLDKLKDFTLGYDDGPSYKPSGIIEKPFIIYREKQSNEGDRDLYAHTVINCKKGFIGRIKNVAGYGIENDTDLYRSASLEIKKDSKPETDSERSELHKGLMYGYVNGKIPRNEILPEDLYDIVLETDNKEEFDNMVDILIEGGRPFSDFGGGFQRFKDGGMIFTEPFIPHLDGNARMRI